jgi:transcriptional regulator with XRE-family HTH domain
MLVSKIDQYVIDNVRERRKKFKISQQALANELGVTRGFIGNVENPNYKDKYNLEHLNSIAKIFQCAPKDFLPDHPL